MIFLNFEYRLIEDFYDDMWLRNREQSDTPEAQRSAINYAAQWMDKVKWDCVMKSEVVAEKERVLVAFGIHQDNPCVILIACCVQVSLHN